MAVTEVKITIFQRMLEKKLFPDNDFTRYSRNGGQPNADTIEIPQSDGGNEPVLGGVNSGYDDVANNLANATALTAVVRVNTKKSYSNTIVRLPEPFVYETLQDVVLSYNKANEIATEEAENMNTAVANYIAIQWQPTLAANIFPTTGLPNPKSSTTEQKRSSSVVTGGYTGLVKKFEYSDLKNLSKQIKKQNVKGGQWYALLTPELWDDLTAIDEIVNFEKTGNETMLKQGVVGRWLGINFLEPRQNDRWGANILYDITTPAAPVKVAYGGTLNTECVSAMLVWNDRYVEKNEGGLMFFSRLRDPIYMGDIVNWGVRVGGASRRLDEKGTIAFYEAKTT
jgi:hypothetical protein